jgi:hypothetical protein
VARPRRFPARSAFRRPLVATDTNLCADGRLVLGLGIGTNATVFTIVNTLLLRPLPFERADDVVQVRRRTPFGSSGSFPMHDYLALTTQRSALSALAILDVISAGRYTLMMADAAEPISACRVSAEFFAALGVSPVRGRLFRNGDDVPGGAGLLTRSFWNLASVDPGFQVDGLLTMSVSMTPTKYPDSARLAAYTDAVALRLERIPGVLAASSTTALPSEFPIDFPVSPVGRTDRPTVGAGRATELDAWYRAINPHYFSAMEIPLLNGRVFTDSDSANAAPVAVVNQALAHAAFPNGDALGQALVIGGGYLKDARDLRPRTIIGVVGDTRERGLRFAPTLTTYVPVAQSPELITRLVLEKIPLRWVLRTDREPTGLVPAVRQAVLAVDPTQPATDFARMSDVLGRSISAHRFNMLILTMFSGLALALAAIGVYGLTAYAVAQRAREIGIRISLGASPAQLVRGLLGQGLRLCLAGALSASLVPSSSVTFCAVSCLESPPQTA